MLCTKNSLLNMIFKTIQIWFDRNNASIILAEVFHKWLNFIEFILLPVVSALQALMHFYSELDVWFDWNSASIEDVNW